MANRTDDFNRANGAIGTPSDAGSAWVVQSGTWEVASNAATMTGAGTPQATAVLESSLADVDVQATFVSSISDSGLCARATDDSNYILAAVSATTLRAFKRDAGSFTQLGSTYTGTISSGDVIKLRVSGDNIIISQNGTDRVTTTSAFNNTATKHGLRSNDTDTTVFDDFTITSLAAAGAGQGVIGGGFGAKVIGAGF